MHVEPTHTRAELEKRVRCEKDARVAARLRAVLLAMKGRTHTEIAGDLCVSPRSVQEWVRRYNQEGLAALPDKSRPGQPKKLTSQEEAQVTKWLETGPDLGRDKTVGWRGSIVNEKINAHFGKKFSLSGAYALMHRLGFEPLRPRPIHRHADPAKQEEFKKSAPLLSGHSGVKTRAGSSRSGGRTR